MVNYIIGNISKTLNLKIYKIKKWEKKIGSTEMKNE